MLNTGQVKLVLFYHWLSRYVVVNPACLRVQSFLVLVRNAISHWCIPRLNN